MFYICVAHFYFMWLQPALLETTMDSSRAGFTGGKGRGSCPLLDSTFDESVSCVELVQILFIHYNTNHFEFNSVMDSYTIQQLLPFY